MKYSQFDEESYILRAFQGAEQPGRFLDIGGWNPKVFSNTRALYEAGWSGVIIEPSPAPMQLLLDEYGNDARITLIQAAVACAPGLLSLHITDDAVSTGSEVEYERWKDVAKFRGRMLVPIITMEEIGTRFGGHDFVSIDAEGFSADLFLQMIALGWRPRCVVVEHDSRITEILSAASQAGYVCVLTNSTNVVLVTASAR